MGILDDIKRRARTELSRARGEHAVSGRGPGRAVTPKKKKKAPAGGAVVTIAIPKRQARAVLHTLEQVGYQLVGQASMTESGAREGTAADAKQARKEAEHLEIVRRALAHAL